MPKAAPAIANGFGPEARLPASCGPFGAAGRRAVVEPEGGMG